jgi:hypothetical protein
MHPIDFHPRHLIAFALSFLLVALLAALAGPPDLATWDFSLGGDAAPAAPSAEAPAPDSDSPPVWVTDPLRPPFVP